jgi:PII-like signaling protein
VSAGTPGVKLSVLFGERARGGRRFLAEELIEAFAGCQAAAGVLLRAVEGFGGHHRLRTDRLLTLSEDLSLVAVAVIAEARLAELVARVEPLAFDGIVALERVHLHDGAALPAELSSPVPGEELKLTAYLGRGLRGSRGLAHRAAVATLHECGVGGATVLLGVDGVIGGERRRAGFLSPNRDVPAMVLGVGNRERIGTAAGALAELAPDALITVERGTTLKRDGIRLAELPAPAARDRLGRARWQRLTLFSSEQHHAGGSPAHVEAVRRLAAERAAGATALRGIWGYHGEHAPHGESLWGLRRRVPTVTSVIDSPERCRRWLAVLDELTPARGLITAETVPALRAAYGGELHGGLELADPWSP